MVQNGNEKQDFCKPRQLWCFVYEESETCKDQPDGLGQTMSPGVLKERISKYETERVATEISVNQTSRIINTNDGSSHKHMSAFTDTEILHSEGEYNEVDISSKNPFLEMNYKQNTEHQLKHPDPTNTQDYIQPSQFPRNDRLVLSSKSVEPMNGWDETSLLSVSYNSSVNKLDKPTEEFKCDNHVAGESETCYLQNVKLLKKTSCENGISTVLTQVSDDSDIISNSQTGITHYGKDIVFFNERLKALNEVKQHCNNCSCKNIFELDQNILNGCNDTRMCVSNKHENESKLLKLNSHNVMLENEPDTATGNIHNVEKVENLNYRSTEKSNKDINIGLVDKQSCSQDDIVPPSGNSDEANGFCNIPGLIYFQFLSQ